MESLHMLIPLYITLMTQRSPPEFASRIIDCFLFGGEEIVI